jgi:hypothetical protein
MSSVTQQSIPAHDLIPLREAIDLLPRRNGKKVHRSTVQRWIDSRKIATTKIGGIRYASRSQIRELMTVDVAQLPVAAKPPARVYSRQATRKAAGLKAQAKAAIDRLTLLRAKC